MKKTFQLKVPGRDDQRVLEAVKNDVRKYIKRERRKSFPEGFDRWDFACKVGLDSASATPTEVDVATDAIAALAAEGASEVYVEILASAGHRPSRALPEPEES